MAPTSLDPTVVDRALGAILGTACGDALGAGYEFGPPLADEVPVTMDGGHRGFGWEPGEWTDDTAMTIPVLRAMADGLSLEDEATLDRIVVEWTAWARTATDVGNQTRSVLSGLGPTPTALGARAASKRFQLTTGRSAGNGSLMRTAPVALAYLSDPNPDRVAVVAREVSDLTHLDPDAGDACVLWSVAMWNAVRDGRFDIDDAMGALATEDRRERWRVLLDEAEHQQPRDFDRNGWVVQALQGAWSAMTHAGLGRDGVEPTSERVRDAIERAVRGGRDTDTVAAIAGALVGAVAGASFLPAEWLEAIHGWPGIRADELTNLARAAIGDEKAG
jgi:ADP-ribosylglycohydrolase